VSDDHCSMLNEQVPVILWREQVTFWYWWHPLWSKYVELEFHRVSP